MTRHAESRANKDSSAYQGFFSVTGAQMELQIENVNGNRA